jgi:hypothetical protein
MDKPTLYSVVSENEDDPHCAHWDETIFMTHSLEAAKERIEEFFQSTESEYFPRVRVFEYDRSKEKYVFKNEKSVFFNTWEITNVGEISELISEIKEKSVETRFVVETDDFFLGRISVDIPVEIGKPLQSPLPGAVGVYYGGRFVWNIWKEKELGSQLKNTLMTVPFYLNEQHRRYCLLFIVKEFIKEKYDEIFKKG